jgi:dTDP-4-dehydrorhamnose reductase
VRWLITGSGGRLGTALIARLTADDPGLTGAEDDVILPLDRLSLDVTDTAAVREAVSDFRPDVVVNTAGFGARATDAEEQRAYSVNAVGPAVLALAVAATGGRLVHVSSDLVFAGDAIAPYPVDAPAAPRSAYGRTKRAGELAVRELLPADGYVVRTSWLYGGAGDEVIARAVRLAAADQARGPADEVAARDGRLGSPTWVGDLAEGLIALSRSNVPAGIYHCTNSGQTTRLGFARAVRAELGAELGREPDRAGPDPSTEPPPQSGLGHCVLSGAEWAAAGLPPLPHWRDALHRAFVIDGKIRRTG